MLQTQYLINEGSYQKLKEISNYRELVSVIDVPGSTSIILRLGRNMPACSNPHPKAFTLPLNADRIYVSCYRIDVTDTRHMQITFHGLHSEKMTWTMPIEYLSPVVFMYYAATSDIIFEDLLGRICYTAAHTR